MATIPTSRPSTRSEVSVVLKEDDWHYVIAKLRKAIEPGCHEKSYCQLWDVIPKIEKQVKEAKVGICKTRLSQPPDER